MCLGRKEPNNILLGKREAESEIPQSVCFIGKNCLITKAGAHALSVRNSTNSLSMQSNARDIRAMLVIILVAAQIVCCGDMVAGERKNSTPARDTPTMLR